MYKDSGLKRHNKYKIQLKEVNLKPEEFLEAPKMLNPKIVLKMLDLTSLKTRSAPQMSLTRTTEEFFPELLVL